MKTSETERALRNAENQIKQLCGMVNSYSAQLGLGRKVNANDWVELSGIKKAEAELVALREAP